MKKTIDDSLNTMDTAMEGALKQLDSAVGETGDPDLIFYETMEPRDFMALMRRYGPEQTQDFIKAMEIKRMNNG